MFLDESLFPFTRKLETSWRSIREEMDRLPLESFKEWHEKRLYTNKWSLYGLRTFGKKNEAHCAACPKTAELLESVPGLVTAAFSLLMPGTVIKPHKGYTGAVLRCHLGLRVEEPLSCALKVSGTERRWEEGRCLVFDDTSVHEAWNLGQTPRAVLLLDFMNPHRSPGFRDNARLAFFTAYSRAMDLLSSKS